MKPDPDANRLFKELKKSSASKELLAVVHDLYLRIDVLIEYESRKKRPTKGRKSVRATLELIHKQLSQPPR